MARGKCEWKERWGSRTKLCIRVRIVALVNDLTLHAGTYSITPGDTRVIEVDLLLTVRCKSASCHVAVGFARRVGG